MSYGGAWTNKLIIEVLSGVFTTSNVGYTRIGSFVLTPEQYNPILLVADIQLIAVLETSAGAFDAYLRLFNVTTASVVGSDPMLETLSVAPVIMDDVFTPDAGQNLYEVQLRMNGGLPPNTVTCSHCRIEVFWPDYGV